MLIFAVSALSWLVGFLAYRVALAVFWQQSMSRGDFAAVVVWSIIAMAIAVVGTFGAVFGAGFCFAYRGQST